MVTGRRWIACALALAVVVGQPAPPGLVYAAVGNPGKYWQSARADYARWTTATNGNTSWVSLD